MAKHKVTIKEFREAMTRYGSAEVPRVVKEVQLQIAENLYKRILLNNPVLTGLSRRNWFVGVNAPVNQTTTETSPAVATGDPVNAGELDRLPLARRVLGLDLGQTIWITNSLPYIEMLEKGSSRKAPAGIVRVSIVGLLDRLQTLGFKLGIG